MAQGEYEKIENKAQRFFDNNEWASANAMYLLMLEEKPEVAETYARATVAEIMLGDTLQALEMVPRAMEYKVTFDNLLSDVRRISFSIGNGDLYEDYLLKIKDKYPWLNRVADNYLMQYYAFRQNGPELISYAEAMLDGLPDNRNFLRMLAYGQMLDGRTAEALDTWLHVMTIYPNDYDTILDLANCYDALGDNTQTLVWMKKAAEIYLSPYVERRIDALNRIGDVGQNRK